MNRKNKDLSFISSMTGFATSSGSKDGFSWVWEVKSVNGRGLEIRCRLPQGHEKLDIKIRSAIGSSFKRGNFNVNLTVQEKSQANQFQINRTWLNQLVDTTKELQRNLKGFAEPRLDGLLAARGVIEIVIEDTREAGHKGVEKEVIKSLHVALDSLARNRIEEGTRISKVLFDQLDIIINLCNKAAKIAALQPAVIRKKLNQKVVELLKAVPAIPDERLAQEVAVLMIKADIREELDRLQAHIESAGSLMKKGGVIGRQLDFLCQEFNREVNTLCSKASDIELSNMGLELKTIIEQYREQVQNIE